VGPAVRGVLFDFGHTLFDTAGSVDLVVERSRALGHPIDRATAHDLWDTARIVSRTPEEMAKGRDRTAALHRSCWLDLWQPLDDRCPGIAHELYEFETGPLGWTPFVDVIEVLGELQRRGIPMAVVSDVAFDLRPIFKHHGVDAFIHTYVLSFEAGSIKPDGKLFGIAANAIGVPLSECLMVGDNPSNDGFGALAGVRTLLLPMVASGTPRGLANVLRFLD
jgi:HAD superfamily hydrolase (TIGR01549 family)